MAASYVGTVKTIGEAMARSVTEANAFKIFMDEPEELGGRNGAPNPLDYFLAAYGGCLNFMTFFIAKEMGIPVEGTEINITGKLDPSKFAGTDMNVRAGFQEIAIEMEVKSSASSDQITRLLEAVEARCPVSDNITNTTPVTVSMTAI